MNKRKTALMFTLAFAFLTILGCGGGDDMPCLTCPDSYYEPSYTDKGNSISSYRTVTINGQVWMAENLNYKVAGSKCYGEGSSSYSSSKVQPNCDEYGRLYDWATAMALPSTCNSTSCSGQVSTKHRGICPTGWHIPSNEDWDKLMRYVDGRTGTSSPYDSPTAGRYLKATSEWNSCGPFGSGKSHLCEDTHGFSALPGGYGFSDGDFLNVGISGFLVVVLASTVATALTTGTCTASARTHTTASTIRAFYLVFVA